MRRFISFSTPLLFDQITKVPVQVRLKGCQLLIKIVESTAFPSLQTIASVDVTALYPSLDISHMLRYARRALTDFKDDCSWTDNDIRPRGHVCLSEAAERVPVPALPV